MIASLAVIALGASAQAITFTGDVAADFAGVNPGEVVDGSGDVGLPMNAPQGTETGWDIERALFDLDLNTGELNIGIAFYGEAGDADGDGGEGTTTPWLAGNGGMDLSGLAMTESICIAFDFDGDLAYDVIAGVSSWDATYQVAAYQMSPLGLSFSFGAALPNANGHFLGSDFEMSITDIAQLVTPVQNTICFNFGIFAGSIQDDGIGEDFLLGQICLTDDDQVEAVLPASTTLVSAYPNPFNPTTTLNVELAETGNVDLRVYNIQGQLVSTLANGMMEAGRHELQFNGAGLPSGMYLARLTTDQGSQVERLLLAK
jgi:hypothetical protein